MTTIRLLCICYDPVPNYNMTRPRYLSSQPFCGSDHIQVITCVHTYGSVCTHTGVDSEVVTVTQCPVVSSSVQYHCSEKAKVTAACSCRLDRASPTSGHIRNGSQADLRSNILGMKKKHFGFFCLSIICFAIYLLCPRLLN